MTSKVITLNDEFLNKVFIREELSIATLQEGASNDTLPEGGFINKDSHLLTFVSNYFEDELKDEPDYEDYYYDDLLFPDDGVESSLNEEEF